MLPCQANYLTSIGVVAVRVCCISRVAEHAYGKVLCVANKFFLKMNFSALLKGEGGDIPSIVHRASPSFEPIGYIRCTLAVHNACVGVARPTLKTYSTGDLGRSLTCRLLLSAGHLVAGWSKRGRLGGLLSAESLVVDLVGTTGSMAVHVFHHGYFFR